LYKIAIIKSSKAVISSKYATKNHLAAGLGPDPMQNLTALAQTL